MHNYWMFVYGALCAEVVDATSTKHLYTVSQRNVPPLACYDFDTHEWILIFFGRNVTAKVGNQKTL